VVHLASLRHPKLSVALATLVALVVTLFQPSPASASSVTSASLNGGAGTVRVAGTLYAKDGGALTLTVTTSSDTRCVELSGAFTTRQTSSVAKSSRTFSLVAGAGEGVKTVTASAAPNLDANNCTGKSQNPASATFVLDNTGPTVTAALSPTPDAAGWANTKSRSPGAPATPAPAWPPARPRRPAA
jgi:hypothetical protein